MIEEKKIVCVDEVGRGCCAGPVIACAYLVESDWTHPKLNDSKKMTENARSEVYSIMSARKQCSMMDYEIGLASVEEIDKFNILEATYIAMHRAIAPYITRFGSVHIMVDGDRFKSPENCTYECIIGGDAKVTGIAIASVAAKVTRDKLMASNEYHGTFPMYGWADNKGYVTKYHLDAIRLHGYTKHHRMSFDLGL